MLRSGNIIRVELAVAKNEDMGLVFHEGASIGISIEFLSQMDGDGDKRSIAIYKPNCLFPLTLGKS